MMHAISVTILCLILISSVLVASGDGDDGIHIVFSTDCSFFQDWQTLLVFHSAMKVGQKGKITRIASGCRSKKQVELMRLYATLFPQYSAHFTPDYKYDETTSKKYDFYNKPFGVMHWLEYAVPPIPSGVIIALIDPDFIFLRPLVTQIAGHPSNIFQGGFNFAIDTVPEKVAPGVAVAQKYGLGAPWTNSESRNFDKHAICGEGSPCLNVTAQSGEEFYSVGPPYLVDRDDLFRLTQTWTKFVPRVYSKYPELLAEMYAYSMAAAHEQLPHFTMNHYMVSNTFADDEGWAWIDSLGYDVCQPPTSQGVYYPGRPLPIFLHYCQFFRAGNIGFQKRRIRQPIFDCEKPIMMELPLDLGKSKYKNKDGEVLKMSKKQARRNAFALCTIHSAINAMLTYYKQKMCPPGTEINLNQTINVVSRDYWL